MFAVVDILGQQFKVSENNKYYVPLLAQKPETEITFDKVLLLSDGKETKVGSPVVEGAKVTAKVLEHLRDDKVLVFKKKRRKGYQKLNGHRQHLTRIEVTQIG
ncbi:MAG: 50S ribosomal protein L21 [Ignavibacteriaceae bacterium]|jgi:large subunit ribosomal protein L21|nr:50S ribosomal protein L21 [Ignavibacteriaceae bacterium]